MPTIIDIARLSGFSKSTVSRVINNDPKVKRSTKEKIEQAIKDSGYIHNDIAACMISGYLKIVLIVVGDIENPYYSSSVKVLEKILYSNGYAVSLCNTDYQVEKEVDIIRFAAKCHFSGIILMTAIESEEMYEALSAITCPVVLMNRYLRKANYDSVIQNNFNAAYKATNFLIENGHKRIVHLAGIGGTTATDDRIEGYLGAMKAANLPVENDMVVYGKLKIDGGIKLAKELAQRNMGYTAVFIANEVMAVGFLREWLFIKKRIPDDISIICFDRTAELDLLPVNITTIGVDSSVLGEEAANILLKRMNGFKSDKFFIQFEAKLSVRESVKDLRAKVV